MNEATQKQILEWFQQIAEGVKQGAQFIGDQAPLVVQEKIRYEIWSNFPFVFLCAACFVGLWIGLVKFWRAAKKDKSGELWPIWWFVAVIGNGVIGTFLLSSINDVLLPLIAPRVYILQWIMKGLK